MDLKMLDYLNTPPNSYKVCQVRWIRGLEMEADFWRGKLSLNPEENVSLERLKRWLSTGEVPWTLPGDDLCHYLKDARRTGSMTQGLLWLQWAVWPQKNRQKFKEFRFLVDCPCKVFAPYHEFWILDQGLWHQSHCNVKINQWRSLQLMALRDSTWRSVRVFDLFLLRFGWVVNFEDTTIVPLDQSCILQISEGLSQRDSLNFRHFLGDDHLFSTCVSDFSILSWATQQPGSRWKCHGASVFASTMSSGGTLAYNLSLLVGWCFCEVIWLEVVV